MISRLYITVQPVKLKGLWLKPLKEYNELKHKNTSRWPSFKWSNANVSSRDFTFRIN